MVLVLTLHSRGLLFSRRAPQTAGRAGRTPPPARSRTASTSRGAGSPRSCTLRRRCWSTASLSAPTTDRAITTTPLAAMAGTPPRHSSSSPPPNPRTTPIHPYPRPPATHTVPLCQTNPPPTHSTVPPCRTNPPAPHPHPPTHPHPHTHTGSSEHCQTRIQRCRYLFLVASTSFHSI